MKKIYSILFFSFVLLLCGRTYVVQAQTYAPLPFAEHFDDVWIDQGSTHDVPSVYWSNSPVTGNNSWRRDDEGESKGAWDDSYGAYTPTGARGTSHSARFHSYTSSDKGELNAYIDFSTLAGNKLLAFNYINLNGTDSLEVFISVDGGKYFSKLQGLTIQPSWTKVLVSLGNITTTQGIIKFKATSDYGFSDIGLDEVSVTGSASLVANFTADITVMPSSSATVNFKDKSTGNPTSWKWDFNNDGVVDATTQNPSYTYALPGIYSVRLIVENQITKDTLLLTKYISITSKATVPFTEHFENTWINGNDVRDIPSMNWVNTPATGNNSWSRDDDGDIRGAWGDAYGSYSTNGANGTSHSARFHSYFTGQSGTLDLNVDFSTASGEKTLTYYYNNEDGDDYLDVFLSAGSGKPFVKVNSQSIVSGWQLITVNLGDVSYPNGIIRFMAYGDNGYTDIGIDEVSITGVGVSNNVKAAFISNVNNGYAPLTVRFSDMSGNSPTSWSWDFKNDGTEDATTPNPSYTFTTPGIYNVKLKVSNASTSETLVKNACIVVKGFAALPFVENFDHTWINLSDTIDVPSIYWQNSPATGENSWSRDDQGIARKAWSTNEGSYIPAGANGTDHSASFNSYASVEGAQGTFDLRLDFSSEPLKDTLYYSYINPDGTDILEIFLSKDNGVSFTKIGSNAVANDWTKCKIGLGDVNAKQGILRFVATSDYLYSNIGLDEVKVSGAIDYFLKSLTLPGQTGVSVFDSVNHTIAINLPYTPNVSALIASYKLSNGATASVGATNQVSGTTTNNFSGPLTYTVTDKDGVASQDWVVTVTVAKNNQTAIVTFSVPDQNGTSVIDGTAHTVSAKIPTAANLTAVVPTFTLSGGASAKIGNTAQISGTTSNNFTNAVSYVVLAEDNVTTQTWVVTISKSDGIAQVTENEGAIIFPNPSSGSFHVDLIQTYQGKITIAVYDLKGAKIYSQELNGNSADQLVPIDLLSSPAGLYTIIIRKGENVIQLKLNKI